jgi:hypothetical protein
MVGRDRELFHLRVRVVIQHTISLQFFVKNSLGEK